MAAYIPRQGDIVALTFDPQSGHEQTGRRPALVISKRLFNRGTGMAIVCPITNTFRNLPFHVAIHVLFGRHPANAETDGALCPRFGNLHGNHYVGQY